MKNKKKRWQILVTAEQIRENSDAGEIAQELSLALPAAQLLVNRGYATVEAAEQFLGKGTEMFHDPFALADMQKAVDKIIDSVEKNKKIVIYGDYDVDGVTSVSILYLYLKKRGADISYYIPCRSGEGYGMSEAAVRKLAGENINLIITVDTGITAHEEASLAKSLGMEVVITDHHECRSELPDVHAVVNPRRPDCQYPFKELAGVGVVFKLLCALEYTCRFNDMREGGEKPRMSNCVRDICGDYADLTAIGTVADVMPIKDENRLIVSVGLGMLEESRRPGLDELIEACSKNSEYRQNSKSAKTQQKKKISSGFIGYTIAPRINAAGRISSASIAVELFLTEDGDRAFELARQLCDINKERQVEENRIADEAYAKIAEFHDFENEPVIVLDDEKWHHGIIGIVASRVTEKFNCPSVLISFEGGGEDAENPQLCDIGKGSGRSVKGMNLVSAMSHCGDYLVKYGGHELAAGLTLRRDMLPMFKEKINEYAKNCFNGSEIEAVLEADCELLCEDISMKLAVDLYGLEPYGVSNPVPVFAVRGLQISELTSVGAGRHTRLILSGGEGKYFSVVAIYFGASAAGMNLFSGDYVDVMFNLDINEFQGNKNLQLIVRDIKLAEKQAAFELKQAEIYEAVKNSIAHPEAAEDDVIPCRDDFAFVYNLLKRELRLEHEVFSMRALLHLLRISGNPINYVKLKFIIKVFQELNFLGVFEIDDDIYRFSYVYVKNKTNLERSNIYKKLKCLYRQP